jgi:hypothetical protein
LSACGRIPVIRIWIVISVRSGYHYCVFCSLIVGLFRYYWLSNTLIRRCLFSLCRRSYSAQFFSILKLKERVLERTELNLTEITMTNRSKLNRWIELNNDTIYKSLRGPAYFKVHVV